MPSTSVIGLQWGDEAKGKIVDILTDSHDIVVRYQGGANAGHTVVRDGEKYKLSLIPSGIFAGDVPCIIAGGVVLNPASILEEIETLTARGVKFDETLRISDRAHVILPWHFEEDRLINEKCSAGEAIGTTLRGIGPCYRDKVGRSFAIRLGDLFRDDFREKIEAITAIKCEQLRSLGHPNPEELLQADAIFEQYSEYAAKLKPYAKDTTAFLLDAIDEGKSLLFEGAQGALLDIDHGTFPYVTSSNSSGVGIAAGSGVPASCINKMLGILKAYTTRVGGGPFPTELDDETGQRIRDRGNEYGTVTKRPRRCGWFDAVAARYTARLSGVTCLAIMLLDVLSGFDELKICTSYKVDGVETRDFPSHIDDLRKVEPVYESHPGWQEEITEVTQYADLPENARKYIERIAEIVGQPIEFVSVGPDRKQTIPVR